MLEKETIERVRGRENLFLWLIFFYGQEKKKKRLFFPFIMYTSLNRSFSFSFLRSILSCLVDGGISCCLLILVDTSSNKPYNLLLEKNIRVYVHKKQNRITYKLYQISISYSCGHTRSKNKRNEGINQYRLLNVCVFII